MKLLYTTVIASIILLTSNCSTHTTATLFRPSLHNDTHSEYVAEKQRIEQQHKDADFSALRKFYTGTEYYQPWDSTEHEASLALLNAQEDEQYDLCLQLANAILLKNFTSIDGHFGAYNCYQSTNDLDKANFHRYVLKGLINSIVQSGDGQIASNPFIVNSPTEARATIKMLGLIMIRQEPIQHEQKYLDMYTAINPENDELLSFYFDLSRARLHSFKTLKISE